MSNDKEIRTVYDRLDDELYRAVDGELDNAEWIEPTEEEARNGWTAEELTRYVAERKAGQSLNIDPASTQRRLAERPVIANSQYSPHRWRR